MAITYTVATASGTSSAPSITHGLTIDDGDLVIAIMNTNNDKTLTGLDGFTQQAIGGVSAPSATAFLLSKQAGASEPSSYSFTLNSGSERFALALYVIKGADSVTPFNVTPSSTSNFGTTFTPVLSGVTTTTDNALVIANLFQDTPDALAFSNPTAGYTNDAEMSGSQGLVSYSKIQPLAGVVDDFAITLGTPRNHDGWMFAVTEDAAPTGHSTTDIEVTIPSDIDLKWDTTHTLSVTDDAGTYTLDNVTLSAPTGWETVTFTTAPDEASTESFYEHIKTDATVGSYTLQTGDVLAWTTSTGLTLDGQTIPTVSPAATVTGSYKVWSEALGSWSATSTYTINDLGVPSVGDTEKPVITLTGPANVSVTLGNSYTELGATWTDNVDGSGAAVVGGDTVDANTEGTYTVTYNYTDAAGNAADQVVRVVTVAIATTPQYNVEHLIQWIKENISGGTTNAKLKAFLATEVSARPGVNNQLYEYLQLISNKNDHTERYWDWDISDIIGGLSNLPDGLLVQDGDTLTTQDGTPIITQ